MTVIVNTTKSKSSTDTNPTALNRIDGSYGGCICMFRNRNARFCLVISHGLVLSFSGLIPVSIKVPFDLFLHCHFYVLQDERGETRHVLLWKRQTGWADRVVRRERDDLSLAHNQIITTATCARETSGWSNYCIRKREMGWGGGEMERERGRNRKKEGENRHTDRLLKKMS